MTTEIINCKEISSQIRMELKQKIQDLKKQGILIRLAVIVVGENAASETYIRNKNKACEELGIQALNYAYPNNVTEEEILDLIHVLNYNKSVNGILVQLPLPDHIDEKKVMLAILPEKDVDGFHPQNVGALCTGLKGLEPCTPEGIIEILKRSNVGIVGKHCVIVGRSNIVGKPISLLLLKENGTVTICHSQTKNIGIILKQADIVVVAIGIPKFIKGYQLKEGAVVIDVGINRDGNNRICGDVDLESCEGIVSKITPVPCGVGIMTVTMLMKNCVEATIMQRHKRLQDSLNVEEKENYEI